MEESSEQNHSAEGHYRPPNSEADIWQGFAYQFQQLGSKEQEVVQATGRRELYLDACFYDHPEASKGDVWKLIGMDEGFRVQFRALATRAGIALNSPKGISPRDFWLHRLYNYLREEYKDLLDERSHPAPDGSVVTQLYHEDGGEHRCFGLLKTNGRYLFEASDQQGGIRHVCQVSATFCTWLEEQAREQSESGDSTSTGRLEKGTDQAQSSRAQTSDNIALSGKQPARHNAPSEKTIEKLKAVAELVKTLKPLMKQMPKSKRTLDKGRFASLVRSAGITDSSEIDFVCMSNTPEAAAMKILVRRKGWKLRTLQNTFSRAKVSKA